MKGTCADRRVSLQIAELAAEYRAVNELDTSPPSKAHRNGLEEIPVNVNRPMHPAPRPPRDHGPHTRNDEQQVLGEDGDADDENDDTSTVTSMSDTPSKSSPRMTKPSKAAVRAQKKAAKVAKSTSKAAKNQAKHVISVRSEDVDLVKRVLHGDTDHQALHTHPLASDKTIEEVIQRNMGYMSNIQEHKKLLMSSIARRRRSEKDRERRRSAMIDHRHKRRLSIVVDDELEEEAEELETLLTAVLVKLGVSAEHVKSVGGVNVHGSAKKSGIGGGSGSGSGSGGGSNNGLTSRRFTIVANLKALVRDDLDRHENEQRETCVRAGGFWRYVGKPVFDRMTQIAEELDWKTGVKFKEVNGNVEE